MYEKIVCVGEYCISYFEFRITVIFVNMKCEILVLLFMYVISHIGWNFHVWDEPEISFKLYLLVFGCTLHVASQKFQKINQIVIIPVVYNWLFSNLYVNFIILAWFAKLFHNWIKRQIWGKHSNKGIHLWFTIYIIK